MHYNYCGRDENIHFHACDEVDICAVVCIELTNTLVSWLTMSSLLFLLSKTDMATVVTTHAAREKYVLTTARCWSSPGARAALKLGQNTHRKSVPATARSCNRTVCSVSDRLGLPMSMTDAVLEVNEAYQWRTFHWRWMRPTYDGHFIGDEWGLPMTDITLEMDEAYLWRTFHWRWMRPTHDGHFIGDEWGLPMTDITLEMDEAYLWRTFHWRWMRPTYDRYYIRDGWGLPMTDISLEMNEAYLWQILH